MRVYALILGLLVLSIDLLSKWLVSVTASLRYYPVIDGLFTIHYVQNEGIAFGLFHDVDSIWKPLILAGMAVIAVAVVVYYIWETPTNQRLVLVSLGLLLGGILGNFIDRLYHGYVIDFLEIHWGDVFTWPTFNVADMAITSGVVLIIWESFFGELHQGETETEKVMADE
jgi:signal peptidase II